MGEFKIGDKVKYSDRFLQHLTKENKSHWLSLRGTVIHHPPHAELAKTYQKPAHSVDWNGEHISLTLDIHLEVVEEEEHANA